MRRLLIGLFVILVLPLQAQKSAVFHAGYWRGEFVVRYTVIPFQFEVTENHSVILINGTRSELKNVSQRDDSVFIPVDFFDAVLAGKLTDGKFRGRFKKLSMEKPDSGIFFSAIQGNLPRFKITV